MNPFIKKFSDEFTEEHRTIRDMLLDLITHIIQTDRQACMEQLNELAIITGPHFRYEEESLYPILTRFYGDGYINKLFTDHDMAIGRAFAIDRVFKEEFDKKEKRTEAINHVRGLLPHVSDCQGLIMFAEKFNDDEIEQVIDTKTRVLKENYHLIDWATNIRERRYCRF
ncbi:MAG: hemerythrin domain-containing protein [Bacteroidetes bacterium]|jgi:DNA-binding PadR family transcriptional regulator|nr:hemerythrin domain-containing protein [Bacteroidota bacterium]